MRFVRPQILRDTGMAGPFRGSHACWLAAVLATAVACADQAEDPPMADADLPPIHAEALSAAFDTPEFCPAITVMSS
jgi:hypothetical protein